MKQGYDRNLWVEYLEQLGLVPKRRESSHIIYDYPDSHPGGLLRRAIPVDTNHIEVPLYIITNNLRHLGKNLSDFKKWVTKKGNSKGKKRKSIKAKSTFTSSTEVLSVQYGFIQTISPEPLEHPPSSETDPSPSAPSE